jgi:RND family efflux transporter MFP subunit
MSTTAEMPVPERTAMPVAHPGTETPGLAPLRPAWVRRVLAGIVGVLVLALLVGVAPRLARRKAVAAVVAANAAAPMVRGATVDTAPGASTLTLPGSVAAFRTTPIYARAPGYVGQLRVDIGSRVRNGDLLALIDAPELDHQVQQARAMVTQDSASLALARVELARWKQMLASDSAVTLEEVDQKQAAYNVALATLNAAIANWRQLAQLQSYERVVAPFDGVITARNVDPGALVGTVGSVNGSLLSAQGSAAGSLFQLERIDTLRVYVTVPEDNAPGIVVGRPALVTVPALPGDTLRGQVVRTSNALDPAARTLLAEVDVPNPKGAYLSGSYVQVQLPLARPTSALRLPATALVIRDGPPQVVTVGPDSTARFRTVTVGRDYGSWVEVTGGLRRGAVVVLNPPDDLLPGQRVRAVLSTTTNGG